MNTEMNALKFWSNWKFRKYLFFTIIAILLFILPGCGILRNNVPAKFKDQPFKAVLIRKEMRPLIPQAYEAYSHLYDGSLTSPGLPASAYQPGNYSVPSPIFNPINQSTVITNQSLQNYLHSMDYLKDLDYQEYHFDSIFNHYSQYLSDLKMSNLTNGYDLGSIREFAVPAQFAPNLTDLSVQNYMFTRDYLADLDYQDYLFDSPYRTNSQYLTDLQTNYSTLQMAQTLQYSMPAFDLNFPSLQYDIPDFQNNLPTLYTNLPSLQFGTMDYQFNSPGFQTFSLPNLQPYSMPNFQSFSMQNVRPFTMQDFQSYTMRSFQTYTMPSFQSYTMPIMQFNMPSTNFYVPPIQIQQWP